MVLVAIKNIFRSRLCDGGGHHYRYLFPLRHLSSGSSMILGIESSCDDTGCAILNTDGQVLGECVISQQDETLRFGGIMPVIARDIHEKNIDVVVNRTLNNAAMTINDVDAIAVTTKPGLVMSLLVGINYAKHLSRRHEKHFIPIHHMEAHALVGRLVYPQELPFPYLTFLISGGHCLLAVVYSIRKFILLGKSIDDAPGEAFDKIARRLKIFNVPEYRSLSGGAAVENAARGGDASAFELTQPLQHFPNCNFSFAGMKSHIFYLIAQEEQKYGIAGDEVLPNVSDICASFQYTIAKHLCMRLQRAMEFVDRRDMLPTNNRILFVSGGAACNSYFARAFQIVCQHMGYRLVVPPPKYCTDNGVMIGWNGVEKYLENVDILLPHQLDAIIAEPCCPLGEDFTAEVSRAAIKCKWIKLSTLLNENNETKQKTEALNNESGF